MQMDPHPLALEPVGPDPQVTLDTELGCPGGFRSNEGVASLIRYHCTGLISTASGQSSRGECSDGKWQGQCVFLLPCFQDSTILVFCLPLSLLLLKKTNLKTKPNKRLVH